MLLYKFKGLFKYHVISRLEPQKLPLAQMGGGVSCDQRGGRGVSLKLTFVHKGGVGARVWRGANLLM